MFHLVSKSQILDNNSKHTAKAHLISSAMLFVLACSTLLPALRPVHADSETDQLQAQNAQYQQQLSSLYAQQSTLANQIAIANTQAAAIQNQINLTSSQLSDINAQITDINAQISTAQTNMEKQKAVLGEYVRQMYIDGQTSEMQLVLTSKNFSDFVDKSQYLNTMQAKVKESTDQIVALKKELDSKKTDLQVKQDQTNSLLASQSSQKSALDAQNYQTGQLLAQSKSAASTVTTQIAKNNARMSILRAIASGNTGGVANGNLVVEDYPSFNGITYETQKYHYLYDGYNDMYDSGCLITSLAMAHHLSPTAEAQNHSYVDGGMIGDSTSGTAIGWTTANSILSNGGTVIFGIDFNGDGSIDHFVLAVGFADGKYFIDDPYFSPPKSYASSQVLKILKP